MDINGKTIWQVAAGDGKNTDFVDLCLEKDVIVFGPGRHGPWPDCKIPMLADTETPWTTTKAGIIKRFAEDLKPRDLVVLRIGTQKVYAVGEIVGDYGFSELFGKVETSTNGVTWDLQHYRRVRWLWHQDGEPKVFPVYALKFGSSVQHLISSEVRDWLNLLDIPEEAYDRSLLPL